MADDQRALAQGLSELGLDLAFEIQEQLLAYRDLLVRWNRIDNLTAVRDPGEMVARHLLDSLSIAPYVTGGHCLDVGSGAGLPGIPLALAAPDRRFTLLDSQAKRIRFLRQALVELRLTNVEIVHSRVEEFRPLAPYEIVVSRAFSQLSDFIRSAGPHCAPTGKLLAMKGALVQSELAGVSTPWSVDRVQPLRVPGLEGRRYIVIVSRSNG